MRLKRELQMAVDQATEGGLYHVVSRVVWREFIFGEEEKAHFYSLMRRYEAFCGVQIQAFCLMSNHFHILLRVPPRPAGRMKDEEFFGKLGMVYSGDVIAELQKAFAAIRENEDKLSSDEELEVLADALKEPYLKRMWNLSEFVKVIKQRFTRWYNKKYEKVGTLWEGRFKSQLVQPGYAAKMTAAYIDLNPLRAGMVDDPKDYRWCSYGEAVAGRKNAQDGLVAVMNKFEKGITVEVDADLKWKDVMGRYRMILAEAGMATDQEPSGQTGDHVEKRKKKRLGFSKEQVEEILANGGKLSWGQLLRCKSRHFSEGLVIGSRDYVDDFFAHLKQRTGRHEKRKTGARKLRRLAGGEREIFIMRDLGYS